MYLIGNLLLFFMLLLSYCVLFRVARNNNLGNVLIKKAKESESERKTYEENLRITEGNQEKENLLYKLDLLLEHSGVKRHIRFVTTELFLAFIFLFSLITFLIVWMLTEWYIATCIVTVEVILLLKTVLILASLNRKKVEKQIMTFLNMLSNFSRSNDDIITIFGHVYPYLDDPLRSDVYECYQEAITKGNITMAFRKLEMRQSHEKLKDIFRNLEICSRHEANYSTIIAESRYMMKAYMHHKEERKAIEKNARIEILTLIALSTGIIVFMDTGSFFSVPLITLLKSSALGIGIIIYIFIVLVICITNIIGSSE